VFGQIGDDALDRAVGLDPAEPRSRKVEQPTQVADAVLVTPDLLDCYI
jgi:hypothetical protein